MNTIKNQVQYSIPAIRGRDGVEIRSGDMISIAWQKDTYTTQVHDVHGVLLVKPSEFTIEDTEDNVQNEDWVILAVHGKCHFDFAKI